MVVDSNKTVNSYLDIVYSKEERPLTEYPFLLTRYLLGLFGIHKGAKLLDAGCGRGDFSRGFQEVGLEVFGCDISPNAAKGVLDKVETCNFDKDPLPYADNSFDVVYSKSLLEHLHNPDFFLTEVRRILKPGGLCLMLVPDWESNYKIYFDDFSHRTPFTTVSLQDLLKMTGFSESSAIRFRQLPIVWKWPLLNIVCALIAPFVPIRSKVTFFRWSRELMLIGSARK